MFKAQGLESYMIDIITFFTINNTSIRSRHTDSCLSRLLVESASCLVSKCDEFHMNVTILVHKVSNKFKLVFLNSERDLRSVRC